MLFLHFRLSSSMFCIDLLAGGKVSPVVYIYLSYRCLYTCCKVLLTTILLCTNRCVCELPSHFLSSHPPQLSLSLWLYLLPVAPEIKIAKGCVSPVGGIIVGSNITLTMCFDREVIPIHLRKLEFWYKFSFKVHLHVPLCLNEGMLRALSQ